MKTLIISICLLFTLTSCCQKRQTFVIDPRLELLGVLQVLAQHEVHFGGAIVVYGETSYKTKVKTYFSHYKDHPAVKKLEKLALENGFQTAEPPELMLSLGLPPELILNEKIPSSVLEKLHGKEKALIFIQEMRSFAKQSNFMKFYNQYREFYQKLIEKEEVKFTETPKLVKWLESYYGDHLESYQINISPLQGAGAFGVSVGGVAFYKNGVKSYRDGKENFGTVDDYREQLLHEFSHPLANPLIDKHFKLFEKKKHLYSTIKDKLPHYYNSWKISLYEHLVRAVTIRGLAQNYGDERAKKQLAYDLKRGFHYLPQFLKGLVEYEAKRDIYSSLDDFIPVLANQLQ